MPLANWKGTEQTKAESVVLTLSQRNIRTKLKYDVFSGEHVNFCLLIVIKTVIDLCHQVILMNSDPSYLILFIICSLAVPHVVVGVL